MFSRNARNGTKSRPLSHVTSYFYPRLLKTAILFLINSDHVLLLVYFRYNARDGKWLQISSMNVPRTYFSLVALDDCLLAVGGKHNRVAVSSAEKYMFASNEWTSVTSLPNTLFSHAGKNFAEGSRY